MLIALPIILIGLPFAAVATLTRAFSRLLEPRTAQWGQLIEFDPTFGWKSKANLNAHHLVDDVYRVTTDSQGWRGKSTIAESEIVVFGDSFAWGYGIDDKDFFADLNPTLRVKPIGMIGYNMVQEVLWMQRLSSQISGKLVVWFIYCGNDLYENLVPDMYGYRMPFVKEVNSTGEWEIITHHINPSKWLYDSDRRHRERNYHQKLAQLCSVTFLSQRAYSACEFLIRRGRDICNQVGARLVVVSIPDTTQLSPEGWQFLLSRGGIDPKVFDPYFPDHSMQDICKRLDVPFVPARNYLDVGDHKGRDCHWNQRGHRRIAELLTALYEEYVVTRNGGVAAVVDEG